MIIPCYHHGVKLKGDIEMKKLDVMLRIKRHIEIQERLRQELGPDDCMRVYFSGGKSALEILFDDIDCLFDE